MAGSAAERPWDPSIWRTFKEEPASPPASFGNMLGVIAITFGVVALGAYALDLHGHQCESCGHRWHHLGAFNLGDPEAHSCGKCGTVQWWKDGTPHVFREALRQPPPKVMPDTLVSRLQGLGAEPRLALSGWPRVGST